jgi:hypothetical protein
MNEIFDGPSLALSPPCCVAHRSRSFGYAPSSRLAWRQNGGGLTVNNLVHGALGRSQAQHQFLPLLQPVQRLDVVFALEQGAHLLGVEIGSAITLG